MTAGTDERRPSRAALALSALPIARARLRWPIPRTRVSVSAFDIAWLVAVAYIYVALIRLGYRGDAFVYWNSGNVGYPTVPVSGFVYPPPALLVFWPAHLVPFELFYAAWLVVLMGVMRWAIGPWLMLPFIFPNALGWHALGSGNVSLLVGAGVAYGLERRAAWLVPVLTKVTPVIGLGWFLVRREWRPLGVAIGWILLVSAVSFAIAPDLWGRWFGVMAMNAGTNQAFSITDVPPLWRLAVSAIIVILAAWRSAAWALPIAAFYSIGWIADTSLLVCLGTVRLLRRPPFVE